MATFSKRIIFGSWKQGYALDLHTISSEFLGDDEYGHPQFSTKRSEVGELLYRLKYSNDSSVVDELATAAADLLKFWSPDVDILVPVPPSSNSRVVQPVILIAKSISTITGIDLKDCVTRTRSLPELKNVSGLDERIRLLDRAHSVDSAVTKGKNILLFDDLFRSGATMNTITSDLYNAGQASNVYALTITRTRSHL